MGRGIGPKCGGQVLYEQAGRRVELGMGGLSLWVGVMLVCGGGGEKSGEYKHTDGTVYKGEYKGDKKKRAR